jgi:hypothetical protein
MATREMGKLLVDFLDAIRILIPDLLLIILLNFNFLISVVLFFKVLAITHCDMEGTQSHPRGEMGTSV